MFYIMSQPKMYKHFGSWPKIYFGIPFIEIAKIIKFTSEEKNLMVILSNL